MDRTVDYGKLNITKDCVIVDMRDEGVYEYGHIPQAISMPNDSILTHLDELDKSKKYYLYCKIGRASIDIVEELVNQGYDAYSIKDGYLGYLRYCSVRDGSIDKAHDVEESIRKRFHKEIFSKFCKAINEYELLKPNDRVAVCISGGKDSMLMAKLFQELKKHNKFPFEVKFIVMDPGYSPENRELIESNARNLNIPIEVFESDIFENVFTIEKSPCYICARMRRGYLYSYAKKLGCNKIALGHHYDDVIETILMGMLYGAQVQTMMPKVHSTNFEGMELIRPMYLIREKDIKHWRDYNKLNFIQCACRFTESCSIDGDMASKRKKVKDLIAKLKDDDPQIEQNIFKSVENVNLATVIEYKDKYGIRHNFKDDYDD